MRKLNIPKDIAAFFKEHEEERQRAREQLEGRVAVEVTPWNDYKVGMSNRDNVSFF